MSSERVFAPSVALESTVLSHGLPHPENLDTAMAVMRAVRETGARPMTIGYLKGRAVTGLSDADIRRFCLDGNVRKTSVRDIPIVVARGLDGATTVSATMHVAHGAGIRVMATGGIGGVHPIDPARNGSGIDESADLLELSRTPITVVCSGPKAILDLDATRERLETLGVPIVGYRTDRLPAFYCTSTDLPVDDRADTPSDIARIVRARDAAGLTSAVLVVNPLPEADLVPLARVQAIVQACMSRGDRPTAAGLTPFILSRVREEIGPQALTANISLLKRNAALAGRIAVALAS
ncbi:MAG: pseudouridine-5'-phosphate glycosidase [Rhodothermales bacterium]|nr:pseudouridine-5'-phosphate glycosidase [Rhodothermales bacterium]